MIRRPLLASFELVVAVLPMTVFWLWTLFFLGVLIVNGEWLQESSAGVPGGGGSRFRVGIAPVALFWLVGGAAGLAALWSVVWQSMDEPRPPRPWHRVGLSLGVIAASAVVVPWRVLPDVRLALWWRVAAVLAIAVAVRQLLRGRASGSDGWETGERPWVFDPSGRLRIRPDGPSERRARRRRTETDQGRRAACARRADRP